MWINYKVEGGKFFRIYLEEENRMVKSIKITGDFFFYPEFGLEEVEDYLKGNSLDELGGCFDKFVKEKGFEVLGFEGKDLQAALDRR